MLSNVSETNRSDFVRVKREQMGLIERYIMHELCILEQTALQGYAAYNFTKGQWALFLEVVVTRAYRVR
jgi:isoleucyl-tRNA synthetase